LFGFIVAEIILEKPLCRKKMFDITNYFKEHLFIKINIAVDKIKLENNI